MKEREREHFDKIRGRFLRKYVGQRDRRAWFFF